jgi:hypothetical protein
MAREADSSKDNNKNRGKAADKVREVDSSRDNNKHRGKAADKDREADKSRDNNKHRVKAADMAREVDSSRDNNKHRVKAADKDREADNSMDNNKNRVREEENRHNVGPVWIVPAPCSVRKERVHHCSETMTSSGMMTSSAIKGKVNSRLKRKAKGNRVVDQEA